jgi:hypothetical protein
MIRTQIQLTENQARKLRRVASEQNISFAEVIRRCVNQSLNQASDLESRYERARRIVGRYRMGRGKVSIARDHDRYLEDAFS